MNSSHTLYVFKIGGHIVLVDEQQSGWQDYIGRIEMRLEGLLDYINYRYDDGEVRRKIEGALKHAVFAAV